MVTTVAAAPPPPATHSHRTGEGTALPASTHTLASALAFLLGAGVLAAACDPNLSRGAQSFLFWSGLAVSLTATVTVGLRRGAGESQRVIALAGFGVLLYLPYLLRSPEHSIFGEELTQARSARLLAESGHTPADFPGLEFVTLWLHDSSGIGLDSLARVVPLAVHTTAPLLVFGIATAIGLSGRTGFLAALLFLANPATLFIHSAMIPETLGILLFVAAWALVAACARDERTSAAYVPVIVACLAGIVVVDHMSALFTALSFVVLALVTRVMRYGQVDKAAMLAALSIVLLNGWLLLHATDVGDVIAAFAGGVDELVDTVREEAEMRGELFGTRSLPLPERLAGYLYPVVLPLLSLAGMFVLLRRRPAPAPGPLLVALLILGPGLWVVGVLAMFGGASDVASRAWPFLFLGVALCAGLSARLLDGVRTVPRHMRLVAVVGIVGVVMAGAIVVGDNVGGRFPRPAPASAAGPESVTDAPIAAASWLLRTTGRDHALVGDLGSELVFDTFGEQRPLSGNDARPFVAKTPGRIAHELERGGASYVVIDRRISLLPPRFGYYFSPEELDASNRSSYGQPFPLAQLDKLDRVRTLSLMYDNGTTVVYGPAAHAPRPAREP